MGDINHKPSRGVFRRKIFRLPLRAPEPVYDHVLELLKRNHGRKLREVIDAELDIFDLIQ
jgi:hypothetical protein